MLLDFVNCRCIYSGKFISEGPHVKNDQGTQSDISMADGTLWSMFPLCKFKTLSIKVFWKSMDHKRLYVV